MRLLTLLTKTSILQPAGLLRLLPTISPSRSVSMKTIYWKMDWKEPEELDEVIWPPNRRRLHPMQKVPMHPPGIKPALYPKRLIDKRGPELIHNRLIHNQFGLQALEGGDLAFGHFEVLRLGINRQLNERNMFAVWRVSAPWKPKTKRPIGKTLGGGRPGINHYVTPVRADRIIVEMGGVLGWREAYKILNSVALKMPFPARFVSREMLEEEAGMAAMIEAENVNPFTFEAAVKDNLAGCHAFLSPWHHHWGPKYR